MATYAKPRPHHGARIRKRKMAVGRKPRTLRTISFFSETGHRAGRIKFKRTSDDSDPLDLRPTLSQAVPYPRCVVKMLYRITIRGTP